MDDRIDLNEIFCHILGTRNVYFQPPESVRMEYPAITYSISKIDILHADNSVYKSKNAYSVILIDENPDSEFLEPIIVLPYCSFDRAYVADNLNHFVFTLYF